MFTRKYTLDDSYFDIIDTEPKAYWLGFIAADGYVSDRRLGITLHAKDAEHLRKFKTALGATYPVVVGKQKHQGYKGGPPYLADFCRFQVTSRPMVEALGRLGIVRRKSLVLRYPHVGQVPMRLQRHYLRGYFDGDGCITGGGSSWQASLIGTHPFMYCSMGMLAFGVHGHMAVRKKRGMHHLIITSYDAIEQFRRFIYKDASVWLNRKYDTFERFQQARARQPVECPREVLSLLLETQESYTNREIHDALQGRHHIKGIEHTMRDLNQGGRLVQTSSGYGNNRFQFDFEEQDNALRDRC